ncbi:MAG: hypothetical protein SNJ82_01875, partial [Gemmataceae bacterium]
MSRVVGVGILLALIVCSSGPAVLAQKAKPKPDEGDRDAAKNTEKNIKAGLVVGRLMNIYEESRKLRVQVSVPVTRLDEGAAANLLNAQNGLVQAQLALRMARDPNALIQARQQVAQAQLHVAQAQAGLYRTEIVQHEIEVQPLDEVIVRRVNPPETFDDKGRLKKKYTKAELKELRGDDPKLPGYKAEFSDLQNDQVVRLHLVD